MTKRTKAQCHAELLAMVPQAKGNIGKIIAVTERIKQKYPEHRKKVRAFKLYWGLIGDREPMTYAAIGREKDIGHGREHMRQWVFRIERVVKHPFWWK